MNYELALKLKEAGFPQEPATHWIGGGTVEVDENYGEKRKIVSHTKRELVRYPTLEELLEQMPMRKKYLGTVNDAHFVLRKIVTFSGEEYLAAYEDEDTGIPVPRYEFYGSALVAVANLWLALNSK